MTPKEILIAAREWQPIETAPHDGTPILALSKDWPEEPIVIVRYSQESVLNPYVWSRLNGDEAFLNAAFSHWMSLPETPASSKAISRAEEMQA